MRFVMDSEMHTSVMNLISTNPGVARVSHSHSIENLAAGFLRGTTPPLEILQLRSPPIFPRDRRPGAATTDSHLPCNLPRLSELPTIIAPVKVENDDDGDSFKQHMMVVDGWGGLTDHCFVFYPLIYCTECYVNPSSPTPSLGSSSSQEIDELFLPSPPRKTDNYLGLLDARLGSNVQYPLS